MNWDKEKADWIQLNQSRNLGVIGFFLCLVLLWPHIYQLLSTEKNKIPFYIVVWDAFFLVVWTLLWSAFAYFLIPKTSKNFNKHELKTRIAIRKVWTAWYDFLWICVAVLSLASQAWRITDQKFQASLQPLEKIQELNKASVVNVANQWLPKLENTRRHFIGDEVLYNELLAITQNKWLDLVGNSYSFGDKRNLYYLSENGTHALNEIKYSIAARLSISDQISSLWQFRKAVGAPDGFEILFTIFISIALGLRLAKAVADMSDSRLVVNVE